MAGYAPPYKIIVTRNNPLTKITIDQHDAIFGAARDGGWVGTAWRVDLARARKRTSATGASGPDRRMGEPRH